MMKYKNLINTNWVVAYGSGLDTLVSVEYGKDLGTTTTNIDDITSAERTVLLSHPTLTLHSQPPPTSSSTSSSDILDKNVGIVPNNGTVFSCRININSAPKYIIGHVMLVCDCSKLELFTGPYEEYTDFYDGELLDEFDGRKSFIFEIALNKKTSHVSLKFITQQEQIWIYGMHLNLIETTVNLFKSAIDIENVDSMLRNQTLSDNAIKCKEFIELHMSSTKHQQGPPNMAQLMSFINATGNFDISNIIKDCTNGTTSTSNQSIESRQLNNDENGHIGSDNEQELPKIDLSKVTELPVGVETITIMAKQYFEKKITDMEVRIMENIDKRFIDMEKRQNEKLDKILKLLTTMQEQ